ncbi:DUF883 family protein [Rhizobium sp. LjRoot98]|uniref:DUF883 family protein n=1 Tax=unclassified Rhizobium TaxID=2613769 RepID=UPI00071591C6|nr:MULTISPECIES: DUF883 family protein [unclassified Rhizobium]KQV29945.1 hypothetical protein ASC96_11085 [Rhizobium sp. Root1204]KQY04921.1 hypothetical protein ASD36_10625 [Rhizobium sp. Root1334]KRC01565.1 hypothetical protein ASE23_08395 [Rhizobium sp. Root73]
MATGLFSGARKRNGSLLDAPIEDQISEIRDEIASLAKLLSQRGADASRDVRSRASEASKDVRERAHDARDQAEAGLQDLLENAEALFAELRSRYSVTEKQVRRTVRQHPVATLGAAAALGLLVASMIRR